MDIGCSSAGVMLSPFMHQEACSWHTSGILCSPDGIRRGPDGSLCDPDSILCGPHGILCGQGGRLWPRRCSVWPGRHSMWPSAFCVAQTAFCKVRTAFFGCSRMMAQRGKTSAKMLTRFLFPLPRQVLGIVPKTYEPLIRIWILLIREREAWAIPQGSPKGKKKLPKRATL